MNRSFFSQLQRYRTSDERNQEEDFFTEVVVGLFRHRPEILRQWLGALNIDTPEDVVFHLDSQRSYSAQDDTDQARRPDIYIGMTEPDGTPIVVFVESKLGSKEGPNQLRDYARILAKQHRSAFRRELIYVTTHYDPKEESKVCDGVRSGEVAFTQTRWHVLYRILASSLGASSDFFIQNMLRFMEELGMATANQFKPEDFVAFRALPGATSIMKEVLHGDIEVEFKRVLEIGGGKGLKTDELLKNSRYSLRQMGEHLQVLLGFFLNRGVDYPTLGLILEVRPPSVQEAGLFDGLRDLVQGKEWEGKDLGSESAWSGIVRERSLREFVPTDDHVFTMKEYCRELIGELEAVREANPNWFTPSDAVDEEDPYSE